MNPSASEHGAKEFLISRIVEEARSAGIPLSEVERKMLYFSETGWTLPDIMQVNEQFDLSYGMEEYEKKIADLAGKAAQRAQRKSPDEYQTWRDTIQLLERGDHYISVLIGRSEVGSSQIRLAGDTANLLGAALLLVGLLIVAAFVSSKYEIDFWKYFPSSEAFWSSFWIVAISAAICYLVVRRILGTKKADDLQRKIIGKIFQSSQQEKE
ncbi:MAG: hypothetical protein M3O09_17160 [Acidobacteriota bacterium]|nr:hypothetical protein [Acidobacteriota bacterium]